MCGIAGIISRNGERQIGSEMTRMLQSMKHRGPDSTGYALYGPAVGRTGSCASSSPTRTRRATTSSPTGCSATRPRSSGASRSSARRCTRSTDATEYAFEAHFAYDGDLKALADRVEDVARRRGALARALAADRQGPRRRRVGGATATSSAGSAARTRSGTCGWRRSPTSTSPARTRTGRIRSPTSPSCTTGS